MATGRARGRRSNGSLVILVASSAPLDQYISGRPEYICKWPAESAQPHLTTLIVVTCHVKCAAFELPFVEGESFGLDVVSTEAILNDLAEHRVLRRVKKKWYWSSETYPAEEISLRTAAPGNVVILDGTEKGRVIGEIDLFAAPTEVYENAIYIHQSEQYTIEHLGLDDRKAYARPVETDYCTDAQVKVDLRVMVVFEHTVPGNAQWPWGVLCVPWPRTMY